MTAAVALSAAPSVILRDGEPADHAYVYATWLRHYRRHSADAQRVAEATYTVEQHELIRGLLSRSQLLCAVDSEDPSLIAGYVVSGSNALHWIHVKSGYRGHGVAALLAGAIDRPLYFTHAVPHAVALWRALGLAVTWNPYRAWNP